MKTEEDNTDVQFYESEFDRQSPQNAPLYIQVACVAFGPGDCAPLQDDSTPSSGLLRVNTKTSGFSHDFFSIATSFRKRCLCNDQSYL